MFLARPSGELHFYEDLFIDDANVVPAELLVAKKIVDSH